MCVVADADRVVAGNVGLREACCSINYMVFICLCFIFILFFIWFYLVLSYFVCCLVLTFGSFVVVLSPLLSVEEIALCFALCER